MRFKNLDLNLLVALDCLLQERSVSAAATKMNLSQSAMSGALSRLRDHFQDDLLVQLGRSMVRSSFAEDIAGPLRQLLLQIESTVGAGANFHPATSKRKFMLVGSDYITEVLLTDVLRIVAERAPGVFVELSSPGEVPAALLESGEIDLLIIPDIYCSADHPRIHLYDEEYVVVGWTGNETLKQELTFDGFFALGHVVVRFARAKQLSFAEAHMRTLEKNRRVEIVAPTFTSVPRLLVGTQRIALLQKRLARLAAQTLPLTVVEAPFVIPTMRETLQYNRVRETDAGLMWLRDVVVERSIALR